MVSMMQLMDFLLDVYYTQPSDGRPLSEAKDQRLVNPSGLLCMVIGCVCVLYTINMRSNVRQFNMYTICMYGIICIYDIV